MLVLALLACAEDPVAGAAPAGDAGADAKKSCDMIALEMCEVCKAQALEEEHLRQLDAEKAALLEQKAQLEKGNEALRAALRARGVTPP